MSSSCNMLSVYSTHHVFTHETIKFILMPEIYFHEKQ